MTRYTGVTGQGLPPVPYITHGRELAAELHRLSHLAAEAEDFTPVRLRVVLDVSVIDCVGDNTERAAVIDGLSRLLAGRGTEHHDADGAGGLLRQTLPAARQPGRVDVVVYGRVDAGTPAPESES